MFVREPLERLVSAYRDKMFRAYAYVEMRRYIVARYRPQPSIRCGRVAFFIRVACTGS